MPFIVINSHNYQDINLLRGAVSFIGICLWGQRSVEALKYSSTSVLPSFLQVLSCNHPIVAYEVAISIQRLIKKYSNNLQVVTWDILLDIIESLVRYCQDSQLCDERLTKSTHDILTYIEKIYESSGFKGPTKKFFAILEAYSDTRPTSSVLVQITYHAQYIHPTADGWLSKLSVMMDKYFKYDKRTDVRSKMLTILFDIYRTYQSIYEEEITDIAAPYLLQCAFDERDHVIRIEVIKFLTDIIVNASAHIRSDIITAMERIICTNLRNSTNMVAEEDDDILSKDISVAVIGLIDAFKELIFRQPIECAYKIYHILLDHLLLHYQRRFDGQISRQLRCTLFKWLLQLRINHRRCVGIMKTVEGRDIVQFSPYILFEAFEDANITKDTYIIKPDHRHELWKVAEISYAKATDAILNCLEVERDWNVLIVVLKNMEQLLQYKDLILSGNKLNAMCRSLQHMISDNETFLGRIQGIPYGVSVEDFRACVSCVLEVMICYHKYLDVSTRSTLVTCFEVGLGQKRTDLCVRSLTMCVLEMPDVTLKQLPALLRIFASVEHSTYVAQAILEFLSALSTCSHFLHSLSEDDCKNIIAILVAFTNPYIYAQYTVLLAYDVLLNWFTKCNVRIRQALAGDLINALQIEHRQHHTDTSSSSVRRSRSLRQMEDALIMHQRDNRPRSVTVNVGNVSSTVIPLTVATETYKSPIAERNHPISKARQLHLEMTEICIDYICRISFASYSPFCRKSSQASDILLRNGLSQTYIINGSVITITTSSNDSVSDETLIISETTSRDANQSFDFHQSRRDSLDAISPTPNPDSLRYDDSSIQYHKAISFGLAEIIIRRPTGNVSWILQTNNELSNDPFQRELNEIFCERDFYLMKRVSGLRDQITELTKSMEAPEFQNFCPSYQSEQKCSNTGEIEESPVLGIS